MNSKLLTFKDRKTGKKSVFNPIFITCIIEDPKKEGVIMILFMGSDEYLSIEYPYDEANKRWQEAINS